VLLLGIGHWTQREAPQATNEALLRFLRGLGA
jgi:pimeloyl-ACP methyl ester carboxylesterase